MYLFVSCLANKGPVSFKCFETELCFELPEVYAGIFSFVELT